mmetsp:Transcript_5415/g.22199  ORF Transcript_5415/g.22199 Transcript_5415/m.22199 type:complete len:324 (-) Transcript_5415:16-987(-)
MNSLHRSGHVTPASRMSWRFSNDPWKYFSSVSTDRHAAPPASYALAIFTGSKLGWMTPLDGDAFLTSAMSPGWPVDFHWSLMAPTKSRAGSWFWIAVRTRVSGNFSFCLASHSSLYHTISSRMFWGLFASLSMRSPFSLMVSILNANWSVPTSCLAWPNGGGGGEGGAAPGFRFGSVSRTRRLSARQVGVTCQSIPRTTSGAKLRIRSWRGSSACAASASSLHGHWAVSLPHFDAGTRSVRTSTSPASGPPGLEISRCIFAAASFVTTRSSGQPLTTKTACPAFARPCACDCARTPLPLNVPCRNSRVRKSTRRFPVGSLIAK